MQSARIGSLSQLGPSNARIAEDERVDDAPLRIQHEPERQDRRDRRHRPRQDEQQRQPLDPRARLDEEARQHERDQHLDVDRDQQERERVERPTAGRSGRRTAVRSSPDGARARVRSQPDTARTRGIRGCTARGGSVPTSARATTPSSPARRAAAALRGVRSCSRAVLSLRPGPSPQPSPRLRGEGGDCAGRRVRQPATCLMRAIISSTAFSGVQPSLTTRLIAFAHTFSLLRTVNL